MYMVPYSPRNYYGQIISKPFQLASPDFGTGMVTNGIPELHMQTSMDLISETSKRTVNILFNIPSQKAPKSFDTALNVDTILLQKTLVSKKLLSRIQ